jgi:hypothetical protein
MADVQTSEVDAKPAWLNQPECNEDCSNMSKFPCTYSDLGCASKFSVIFRYLHRPNRVKSLDCTIYRFLSKRIVLTAKFLYMQLNDNKWACVGPLGLVGSKTAEATSAFENFSMYQNTGVLLNMEPATSACRSISSSKGTTGEWIGHNADPNHRMLVGGFPVTSDTLYNASEVYCSRIHVCFYFFT